MVLNQVTGSSRGTLQTIAKTSVVSTGMKDYSKESYRQFGNLPTAAAAGGTAREYQVDYRELGEKQA